MPSFICAACGDNGQRCCIDYGTSAAPSPTGCKAPYLCAPSSGGAYTCGEPVTPAI